MKFGIKWIEVRCNNCGHHWKAKDSYEVGGFYEVANEVIPDCPQCGTSHKIQRGRLD